MSFMATYVLCFCQIYHGSCCGRGLWLVEREYNTNVTMKNLIFLHKPEQKDIILMSFQTITSVNYIVIDTQDLALHA